MRRCRVQRSEDRGWGVGQWRHCFGKKQEREGYILGFFHPETRFQKSAFSGAAFSGSVWTVGQNDAIQERFHVDGLLKPPLECGEGGSWGDNCQAVSPETWNSTTIYSAAYWRKSHFSCSVMHGRLLCGEGLWRQGCREEEGGTWQSTLSQNSRRQL